MAAKFLFQLASEYAREHSLADPTRTSMLRAVALLDAYVGRRATVVHLKPKLLHDWSKSLERQYSPPTIAGYVHAIETIWRFAESIEAASRPAPKRTAQTDDGAYPPSPLQIKRVTAQIRKSWTWQERCRRREVVA